MCLAVPGEVLSVGKTTAEVDFGAGVKKEVRIDLVIPKKGDFVIVHAGFAIQVLDKRKAREHIEEWKSLREEE